MLSILQLGTRQQNNSGIETLAYLCDFYVSKLIWEWTIPQCMSYICGDSHQKR